MDEFKMKIRLSAYYEDGTLVIKQPAYSSSNYYIEHHGNTWKVFKHTGSGPPTFIKNYPSFTSALKKIGVIE